MRHLVQRREQKARENHRPVQQPADQGAEVGGGGEAGRGVARLRRPDKKHD